MNKWVLIPAVEGSETAAEKAAKTASKIVMVYVVDSNADIPTASIGTEIKKAEDRMDLVKQKLLGQGVLVKEYVEWGSWPEKVKAISRIEHCDKVLVPRTGEGKVLLSIFRRTGVEADEA